jgi:hypothetical protein
MQVFHLHSNNKRLTAHRHAIQQQGGRPRSRALRAGQDHQWRPAPAGACWVQRPRDVRVAARMSELFGAEVGEGQYLAELRRIVGTLKGAR